MARDAERRRGPASGVAGQADELAVGKGTLTEGLVQRKADGAESSALAPHAEQAMGAASASSGAPLPGAMRGSLEGSLGVDLGGVRVHTGADSAEAASAVSAQAYTVGQDIHFGAGKFDLGSQSGQHLVAHEVAHTVQQARGGGAPQHKPEVSQPGDGAEREADAVADAFVAGKPAPAISAAAPAVQRKDTHHVLPQAAPEQDPTTKYAKAGASYVYMVQVAARKGFSDKLPVMVFLPPGFKGTQKTDAFMFFHGNFADYSLSKHDQFDPENPAIGADLAGAAAGAAASGDPNVVVIAPQVNTASNAGSPWQTLQPADYKTIVDSVYSNLQASLGLAAPIQHGSVSLAGHSGGGRALGKAAAGLGDAVSDITLQDAGYGPELGEDYPKSFAMVRGWLLGEGAPNKILRVITKAPNAGTDTRHAVEPRGKEDPSTIPLGNAAVKAAIAAKGMDVQEERMGPPNAAGLQLLWKLSAVRHDGVVQGSLYVYYEADPAAYGHAHGHEIGKMDPHFGVRDTMMGPGVRDRHKGDDFGK